MHDPHQTRVEATDIVGVLLACGAGSRFGSHKLLHPLSDGTPLAVASLRVFQSEVTRTIAVVRSGDTTLGELLARNGAEIVASTECHAGMGHSIAAGVRASAAAAGWLIALAGHALCAPRDCLGGGQSHPQRYRDLRADLPRSAWPPGGVQTRSVCRADGAEE